MNIKLAIIGLAAVGGAALMSGAASAMPNGLPQAGHVAGDTSDIAQVRYVCDRFGNCQWRPGAYGAYGYYGPRQHGWHYRPHYQRHHYQGPRHHRGHHWGGHRGGHRR